jgi:hypothetical protein
MRHLIADFDAGPKSASGKPNRGSVDVAGTLVLVSTDALWRQSRKSSQVVALQPDDRESNRVDVRPQQPRRGLSHHVSHVVVPGVRVHRDLLDENSTLNLVSACDLRLQRARHRFCISYRGSHASNCPQCSALVEPGFGFWPRCRYRLTPICPQCHRSINAGDKYCPYCGGDLATGVSTASVPVLGQS